MLPVITLVRLVRACAVQGNVLASTGVLARADVLARAAVLALAGVAGATVLSAVQVAMRLAATRPVPRIMVFTARG
jgi:hypothetical protein